MSPKKIRMKKTQPDCTERLFGSQKTHPILPLTHFYKFAHFTAYNRILLAYSSQLAEIFNFNLKCTNSKGKYLLEVLYTEKGEFSLRRNLCRSALSSFTHTLNTFLFLSFPLTHLVLSSLSQRSPR